MWCTGHYGRHGGAGVLLVADGAVLLAERSQRVHQGGTWSIPGGARARGEDALTTALREAREELGLDTATVRPFAEHSAECSCGWTYTTVLAHLVPVPRRFRLGWETAAVAWVPISDVAQGDRRLHSAFAQAWDALCDLVVV